MIFSDARFFLIFFPIALLFLIAVRRSGNRWLVATSIIATSFLFYLQWNPSDFIVVIASILVNFSLANLPRLSTRTRLTLCVGVNVGYLFFLKYLVATGLVAASTRAGNLFGAVGLPLGISFITFQQIGFVIDQAEGRDREPNVVRYLFFVLFYPHLVAGPLVPHRLLCAQIDRKPFLRTPPQFWRLGFAYFAIGLAKKLLIAEPLTLVNNELFKAMADLSMVEAWYNAFVYSFRIYFDFSAYSDMAVGLAYLMGVQFPRNFESPYKATNIFEFWRTWHISLYKFFRQYLYLRLMRLTIFRRRTNIAILIVLTLSAMWHGVGIGYMLWGWGHAAVMIGRRALVRAGALSGRPPSSTFRRGLATATTFVLVTVLWLPFAINNLYYIGVYLTRLVAFSMGTSHIPAVNWLFAVIPALIAFGAPNSHEICLGGRRAWWLLPFSILLFALASPLAIGRNLPPPPFIYFQF